MKRKLLTLIFVLFCSSSLIFAQDNVFRLGLPLGHNSTVEGLKYSPDGKLLLTISSDKQYLLWDVVTGRLLHVLPIDVEYSSGYSDGETAFTPDGQQVISYSKGAVQFWDITTAQQVKSIDDVYHAIISPINDQGQRYMLLLRGEDRETIELWDAESDLLLYSIHGHDDEIVSLAFSPLGKYIVTQDENRTVVSVAASGDVQFTFENVSSVTFSNDEKRMIVKSLDSTEIYDLGSLTIVYQTQNVHDEYISPDGKSIGKLEKGLFVTRSMESDDPISSIPIQGDYEVSTIHDHGMVVITDFVDTIKVYSTPSGQLLSAINIKDSKLKKNKDYLDYFELVCSPDGKTIAFSISKDHRVLLLNLSTSRDWKILEGSLTTSNVLLRPKAEEGKEAENHFATTSWNSGMIHLWDINSTSLFKKFDTGMDYVSEIEFSSDGRYLAARSIRFGEMSEGTDSTKIWDITSGNKLFSFGTHDVEFAEYFGFSARQGSATYPEVGYALIKMKDTEERQILKLLDLKNEKEHDIEVDDLTVFSFHPTEELFVTATEHGEIKIWDAKTIQIVHEMKDTMSHSSIIFSPNGDSFITISTNGTAVWRNFKQPFVSNFLEGHDQPIYHIQYSPDGKYFMTLSDDNYAVLWDASMAQTIRKFHYPSDDGYGSACFSPDSKYIYASMIHSSLWEVDEGKLLYDLSEHYIDHFAAHLFNMVLPTAVFTSDEQHLVISYLEGTVAIKTESGQVLHRFQGEFVSFDQQGKILITKSREGGIIFWDFATGHKLFQQFVLDDAPLWLLPDGYYLSSKEAASKLYYTRGLQTIGFEQLDVKYNRPHKVLEVLRSIGYGSDTTMITAYKNAWEKRIQRLKINTLEFSDTFAMPTSDFINGQDIAFEQEEKQLSLHMQATDSTFLLDRVNIWVNEVPVFGRNGLSIRDKQLQDIDTLFTITLSQGLNRIEGSVLNSNGIESYRMPLYVNYMPKKPEEERLYFIGIGVDSYQDTRYNLNYSVKDIRDLSQQFKAKYGNRVVIDTLFDADVSKDRILRLIDTLKRSTVDDKIIISFSGHGLLSDSLDYYLAMHNVDFDDPAHHGLPYEDLEFLLDNTPSRKKMLWIDACHSGEVDREEVEVITTVQNQNKALRGSRIVAGKKSTIGLKNSFELMKELYNNVDRATGATVISAAAGTQFAYELGDLKNGVFTYSILDQMKYRETITVSELKDMVSKMVQALTNGLQQPTSRHETIENNWDVW